MQNPPIQGEILGVNFAAQFWMEIVRPNYETYRGNPVAREAFNLATALWHQIDWAVTDQTTNPAGLDLAGMRAIVEPACPELSILHDIATRSKHYSLSRPRGVVVQTKTRILGMNFMFGPQGPLSEHPASYTVVLEDSTEFDLNDVFAAAMNYWDQFFKDHAARVGGAP